MKHFLIFFILLGAINLTAQELEISDWNSFTSYFKTNSIDVDNEGNVYVATEGGVYFVNLATEEVNKYSLTSGLSNLNATSIYYDTHSGKVFTGYNDGVFDIYDFNDWTANFDISNSNFTSASINHFLSFGDRLFIAGDFGIAVFNPEDGVFIEDVRSFADLISPVIANDIKIINEQIYVATNKGLVYTELDNSIANRNDWNVILPEDDQDNSDLFDLEIIRDTLFAASANEIYYLNNENLISIHSFDADDVIGLLNYNDNLHYYFSNVVYKSSDSEEVLTTENEISDIETQNGMLIIGTEGGISVYDGDELQQFSINSPVSNAFTDIYIDSKNAIWGTSGTYRGEGMVKFKDGNWTNYNKNNFPSIEYQSFLRINEIDNNVISAGTFGGGHYFIYPNDSIEVLDSENSPLEGSTSGGDFVVTGDVYEDNQGNDWIVNWGNVGTGPLFVVRKEDGSFKTIYNCNSTSERRYYKMVVDINGTKWIGSAFPSADRLASESSNGLIYYNDNRTLDDASDDYCGKLSTLNSELISDFQTALAIDKEGTLWIGTENGVNRLINPSSILTENNPLIINISSMEGRNVRCIIVDALDNKWIATISGIFVIDPDGEEILKVLNKDNSPLPTNNIFSLEYDENTGRVYIGTDGGLYSLQTSAIKPLNEFDLKVYPQPFNNSFGSSLRIEGLAENSDLRIVTVDGELVKNLNVNSKITNWDGRNENGDKVSPGIYLLYATSESNESTGVIKIAVVND